ncbi:hypothetical protein ACFFMN_15310 [Planobispora siamensis]|uniref:Uncharacterized protein n=1 Tax=Planobispora siamensis TaxID=936338 RepID=A0A8J3SXC1_9ACTN|nr:hypothetical protein [Planobispora siamensis]GIH97258.1 hypothetical protein Psi01_78880 [Planobispora siamensis]
MSGDPPETPAGKAGRLRPGRAAWFHWAAAFATALAPLVYWVSAGPDSYSYGFFGYGPPDRCTGHEFMLEHGYEIRSVVYTVFLFWLGGLPLMLVAFVAWLAGNRWGRPRIGRIVTRVAAVVIVLLTFLTLLPMGLDALLGAGCLDLWGGPFIVSVNLVQSLIAFASVAFMLLAVRRPHRRRSLLTRVTSVVLVILPLALTPVSDTVTGRISGNEACSTAGGFLIDSLEELEGGARFLCAARGGPWGDGTIREFDGMPDGHVLAYGRHLCAAVVRAGGDVGRREPYEELGLEHSADLAEGLRAICPGVVAAEKVKAERARLADEREQAALNVKCAAYPRHRPLIRPLRRAVGAVDTDYNALVALEDEIEMVEAGPLWVEGLAGAEPGVLQVTVADEFTPVCVTAEVYDRRPPLERRGWDEVEEISYRSTRGRLRFVDFYGGPRLVNLTAAGRGAYRVRVHVRGDGEAWRDGGEAWRGSMEQFLIMVYPAKQR